MNKINSKIASLFICLSLVSLYGCSSGLEGEAKKQMEETMKELAKDPSSIQISNVETKFNNDSICILHFKFSGKNGFGGVSSSEIEYIYLTHTRDGNKTKWEAVRKLDEKKSVLSQAKEDYQEKKWETVRNIRNKNLSDEDKKAWYIHLVASLDMIFNGREIDSKDDDIEKW